VNILAPVAEFERDLSRERTAGQAAYRARSRLGMWAGCSIREAAWIARLDVRRSSSLYFWCDSSRWALKPVMLICKCAAHAGHQNAQNQDA
jgi:hypothetical protein